MVTAPQSIQTPRWANAVTQPAQEFGPVSLSVLSGEIPPGLRGSLYRNGPGVLERGGQRVGHWFDGDGGILAVQFGMGQATGLYRYVQTQGYQQETQAGRFLLANYGMVTPGKIWQRFGKDLKNSANTSVLALPGKLLALWEGGYPHALDLKTLETAGLDDLGMLAGRTYSAHPKRDGATGEIFNFGVELGANATLHLYRSDRTGKVLQTGAVKLKGLPMIHDFVLAGRYLVFCVPPVRINALPVLAQLKSFSDAIAWKPELGTEIIVIDRETLTEVSRVQTDSWYQWHYGNGYELPDGSVGIEIARYADFATNQRLKEISTGQTDTSAVATLWQLRIDPQRGTVLAMDCVLDRSCEFPVNQPQDVGKPSRYTYLSIHRAATDVRTTVFDAIARFDVQTGTLTEANLGDHHYPMEPIYAPDANDSTQGWILTVVYDGERNSSEVWIWDSDRLNDEPTCRLQLPAVVPIGFHGTWNPA